MEKYFYQNRICVNLLAKGTENAREIYEVMEGHVLIGVLSSAYDNVASAVSDMEKYSEATDGALSIGLGAGDPTQWKMVADIAGKVEAAHINQVFSAVGYTRAAAKNKEVFINALVRPTEKIGYVNIATGPLSSQETAANVPIETAISMIREMGGNSLKFFPMNGLNTLEQYKNVAKACATADFALEPTGGIHLENLDEIMAVALDAGVKKIIPHIYSSIVDAKTGETRIEDVQKIYAWMKKAGKRYG